MTLSQRLDYLDDVMYCLENTNSMFEKQFIIDNIEPDYKDDFMYVLEVLAGKHKIGFTYREPQAWIIDKRLTEDSSVIELFQWLEKPMLMKNLTSANCIQHMANTKPWGWFVEPIVNRTRRLGIGSSLLEPSDIAPMLAKKYEGTIKPSSEGYYLTEKLDGNRCIASFDGTEWKFTSRNGKPMHVNFDMSNMPTDVVFDGEILSPEQVKLSDKIYEAVAKNGDSTYRTSSKFNHTSGLINRHTTDKKLVYNIFDAQINDMSYTQRRAYLDNLVTQNDVRILPVLAKVSKPEEVLNVTMGSLDIVTAMGGEGLMINLGDSQYIHKRSDSLLKVKKVQTMDMIVEDYEYGTGKYECLVGALKASCYTNDGRTITCKIGTGLSDDQRIAWAAKPSRIIGQVIEVTYFSISQPRELAGTNYYSLRFPRLKAVRHDKATTSEY